jgi:hypothetical protein
MISLKTLIIEGRYDSIVTELSRKLLKVVKDSYASVQDPKGMFAGQKTYFASNERAPDITDDKEYKECYFEEISNETIPLEFYVTLKIQWRQGMGDMISDGGAYNDTSKSAEQPPLIEVIFELDPDQYPNILSEVSMQLRDILRHEIEHLTQSGWNIKMSKWHRNDQAQRDKITLGKIPQAKYYTLPKEIPAMIHGLYMRAKKTRLPFKDVVDDNLQKGVENGVITAEEKEQIKAVWRKYLPSLGITQEL